VAVRLTRVLAAAVLLLASDVALEAVSGALPEAAASRRKTVEVGDVLRATQDVELDEAVVRKGSKVSVSRKSKAAGQVFLDVALADGHVVRAVPLANIVKSFERVED
jgi:hypothetical protein